MSLPTPNSASSTRHVTFLSLPRELRDHIYNAVLGTSIPPPASPASAVDRWENGNPWGADHGIVYERRPASIFCLGLLCCNRQISGEMKSAIARKCDGSEGGVTYKLDIMVQHMQLWPTWTSIPASPQHMRHVEVEIRIFTYSDLKFRYDRRHMPGAVAMHLLRLLSGFLTHGPLFIPQSKPLSYVLHAESLTVNLISIPEGFPTAQYEWEGAYRIHAFKRMKELLGHLNDSGLLSGKVEMVKLRNGDEAEEWEIEDKGCNSGVAQQWARYGWISA